MTSDITRPPTATGRRVEREGLDRVAFDRTFRAPIEDVWAAVTDSGRLARWIGSWTGDPTTGSVDFRMLYEGDDMPVEVMHIEECDEPRRLSLRSAHPAEQEGDPEVVWLMELDLVERDGVTTLTFSQSVPTPGWAEGVGPGWDYYLDRLVAAETGADPAAIDFDDYHPRLSGHYRAEFGLS